MKIFMKLMVAVHVFLFRLTKGRRFAHSPFGTPVLLLTTTGRKSGQKRTVPLGYIDTSAGRVIVASNGGMTQHPGWYFNLKANPTATIELNGETKTVQADEIPETQHAQIWQEVVTKEPSYKTYEKQTTRRIPLMVLR